MQPRSAAAAGRRTRKDSGGYAHDALSCGGPLADRLRRFGRETVTRCVTETTAETSRRICAPAAVSGQISIELPETAPPVTTDGGRGLSFAILAPLPPEFEAVIPEKDLASLRPAPLPPFPAIAIAPPEPPPPPAAPPLPSAPPATAEAAPAVESPAMPAEALRNALRRLKAAKPAFGKGGRSGARLLRSAGIQAAVDRERPLERPGAYAPRRLRPRGDDGLDPERYRTVARFIAVGEPQWPALAAAEAQMTRSGADLRPRRGERPRKPGQVHPLITPDLRHASADAVLRMLDEARDPAAALESFHPPHAQYRLLRTALATARANRPAPIAGEPIPDGPPIRIGMRDPRVPLIRARLGMGYDSAPVYDRAVAVRGGPGAARRDLPRPTDAHVHAADAPRARGRRPQRRGGGDHRQHGVLALDAARPRRQAYLRQCAGL